MQTAKPKTAGLVDYAVDGAKAVGRKVTNANAVEDLGRRMAQQESHMHGVRTTMRNTALIGGGVGVGGAAMVAASRKQPTPEPAQSPTQFKFAEAIDGYSLAVFAGFSDEMQKIAGAMGEGLKRFGNLVAGGAKTPAMASVPTTLMEQVPRGPIGRMFGLAPKEKAVEAIHHVSIPGAGPRVGSGIKALTNPETRDEAVKVLAARGAVGAGVVGAGAQASKKHQEHNNERLGRAYMAGARDMYAQGSGS